MLYWIHLCPIVYAVNPMTPEANVFMVVSVSSRQALERCTQPHLIRTRLFDLLHYPVITQTGYRRTQGLILITLQTIEGNFQAATKAGKYLHTWLLDFASHCCCWTTVVEAQEHEGISMMDTCMNSSNSLMLTQWLFSWSCTNLNGRYQLLIIPRDPLKSQLTYQ